MIARLRVFHRLLLRPMLRERTRTALTVFAVALGVAVVLAIDMAGEAAAGSFRSSMETLAGDADFEVTAAGGVPDEVVGVLAALPFPLDIRARIEDFAILQNGRTVPVLGLDILANADQFAGGKTEALTADSVWAGKGLGLEAGHEVTLQINDRVHRLPIAGTIEAEGTLVTDLATAARLFGRAGRIDAVVIGTPDTPGPDEWEHRIRAALPPGVTVRAQGSRTAENRRMLAAFRWNLRVLSYIALVVGAFLIYNTISVSVVRRRPEIGIARALGASRFGVLAAFLGEALLIGAAGSLGGILLGRLMAEGSVRLISSTVESLYVSSTPAPVAITGGTVLLALVSGLLVTALAALSPAMEAARVSPVEAMARGQREFAATVHRFRDLSIAAVLAGAAAAAWQAPPVGGKPLFGYVAALLLIGSAAFAIPFLVSALSAVSTGMLRALLGVEAMLASRSLAASLRRTSVLTGALATAIAMMTAVGIMVGSFRETVLIWMDNQLQADLYVRPAGATASDRHPTLDPDLPRAVAALPGVAAVDLFRAYEISFRGLPATLGFGDTDVNLRWGRTRFLSGRESAEVLPRLRGRDAAIVSEPFANKHAIRAGDRITVPVGPAEVELDVVDVYYDYANERGYIILDRATALKYLPDPAPSNIAVYVRGGTELQTVRAAIERLAAGRRVTILSNATLKQGAIEVFDRTFAITYALEAVAVVVAVMGVAGALLALVIDRRREFGVLRFLGGSGGQIRKLILVEAGLLGLLANIAGLALGFTLSLLLIFVINKQSFGWTIQFHWPAGVLIGAITLVYASTLLAGLYPARVAARLNPIEVVHEE